MGEIVAKLAQLEHRLKGDDHLLGLEPDRDDLGARRRRIRERALNHGVSLNDSDMSISPTKQVVSHDLCKSVVLSILLFSEKLVSAITSKLSRITAENKFGL